MMMETGVAVLTGHSNCDVRPDEQRDIEQHNSENLLNASKNQQRHSSEIKLQKTGTLYLTNSADNIRFRSKSSGNWYENQSTSKDSGSFLKSRQVPEKKIAKAKHASS